MTCNPCRDRCFLDFELRFSIASPTASGNDASDEFVLVYVFRVPLSAFIHEFQGVAASVSEMNPMQTRHSCNRTPVPTLSSCRGLAARTRLKTLIVTPIIIQITKTLENNPHTLHRPRLPISRKTHKKKKSLCNLYQVIPTTKIYTLYRYIGTYALYLSNYSTMCSIV